MTYLNLVNSVLRRLREDEITTVAESDYSRLIGDFVNDAKRQVEDAWDWSAIRSTFPITTVAGTSSYSLTDFDVRSKVLSVHNQTTNQVLSYQSLERIRQLSLQNDEANGVPVSYTMDGVDANGDITLRLYMTPDDAYSLSLYGVKRTSELTNDTDSTLLPYSPIIQYAYAFALRERGETGGQSAVEQSAFAKQDLNNAIALDANLRPEEVTWYNG
jgi:hypothetical protein